jgi:hypothetical protein
VCERAVGPTEIAADVATVPRNKARDGEARVTSSMSVIRLPPAGPITDRSDKSVGLFWQSHMFVRAPLLMPDPAVAADRHRSISGRGS